MCNNNSHEGHGRKPGDSVIYIEAELSLKQQDVIWKILYYWCTIGILFIYFFKGGGCVASCGAGLLLIDVSRDVGTTYGLA